jgi:DNA-binding GntR family transcriptional regulator
MRNVQNDADELLAAIDDFTATQSAVFRGVQYRAGVSHTELRLLVALLRADEPLSEHDLVDSLRISREAVREVVASLLNRELVRVVRDIQASEGAQVTAAVDPDSEPWSDLKRVEAAIDEEVGRRAHGDLALAADVMRSLTQAVQGEDAVTFQERSEGDGRG